jgi:hypothetical protein
VYSSKKTNPVFPLVLVPLVLLLSSCSERSEYGKKSDYEKLGAACITTEDVTAPTVSSESPTDNSTYNSPATTVAVTFSENMATGSVTTNISDTTCSGSFQLSSDNFTTCIKMSAAPVASDNDTIFTITPTSSLSAATTFKVKITTSVTDISCNTLESDNTSIAGFSTSPSGSGTISGSVQAYDGSPLSGVSLSDTLWGSTVATTTSDSSGDFSQTSLALGRHSVTYSKNGYLGVTLNGLLETDGQTLELETVRMLPDNCTSGTMSGKVTDAVTGDNMSGVGLWWANGMNKDYYIDGGFHFFDWTNDNASWYLNKDAGWYTINVWKWGYYDEYVNVFACGNQPNQNTSLSEYLNSGEMRIILSWPKTSPVTAIDLDSHLYIPIIDINAPRNSDCDGGADKYDKCHLNYRTNQTSAVNLTGVSTKDYHQYTDIVSSGDFVTLDKDHNTNSSPASPPGDETITISKVRSGTYSFSVHNYTDKDNSSNYKTNLRQSRAKVKVFYCPVGTDCNCNACPTAGDVIRKKFHPPNDNGTLWRVFTYNSSDSGSGFTRERTMTYENTRANVY